MLDYEPEPLQSMRKRYGAAVETVYIAGSSPRPGQQRKNVFDCDDGLRLIISRDAVVGAPQIHVSTSVYPGSRLEEMIEGGMQIEAFLFFCVTRFGAISGDGRPITFVGISEGGVSHFYVEEVTLGAGDGMN